MKLCFFNALPNLFTASKKSLLAEYINVDLIVSPSLDYFKNINSKLVNTWAPISKP